jgi:hypothetical protein
MWSYGVHVDVPLTITLMKNAVLWDVAPCRSCVNRHFEGTRRYRSSEWKPQILHNYTHVFMTTGNICSTSNLVHLQHSNPHFHYYYIILPLCITGSIPDEVDGLFSWPNSSSRTVALGSTQPLTEMSTRNLPGSKGRPVCKADNLAAIYGPTV